jgi:uncharacterized membrane protein YoaK (UPF0700 family)
MPDSITHSATICEKIPSPPASQQTWRKPVRETERDIMLFLLAISAGSADGWSYFGLGHAFVANMTGNTVLAGMGVFQKGGNVAHPLLSLACYVLGVAAAAFLTRKVRQGVVWARSISLTLSVEALIMAAAATAWVAIQRHFAPTVVPPSYLTILLCCMAFAVGLQSGAMLQLRIPGVVTTYITGTWTSLMAGLVRFVTHREPKLPRQQLSFEERLRMQAGILAVYFLSAVLTGWLFRYQPLAVGALSAASIMTVAVYAAVHTARASGEG